MEDESDPIANLADDPEIAALLDFEPVVHECRRSNGWTADNQRRFVVALAGSGNVARAATPSAVPRLASGRSAYSGGAEGFAAAWDRALALYLRRNPRPASKGRPSRGEILAGKGRPWPAAAPPPAPPPEPVDPDARERAREQALDAILQKYLIKLDLEREARLEGRIVEADFYVRQLTWLEVALDVRGRGMEVLAEFKRLRRGDRPAREIVATPVSLLLDQARRLYWQEQGGPDRRPPAPLGHHDGELATGLPIECVYSQQHDGDWNEWRRRQAEKMALAAEAQKVWEEKSRKDSADWRARVAGGEPQDGEGTAEGATAAPEPGAEQGPAPGPRILPL